MSSFIHRSRSSRYAFFIALLLGVFPSAAPAAEILIETRIGFHGVFQLGRPFPLEVSVSNIGRPADGVLEVQFWKRGHVQGGAPYPAVHRREVFIPARSSRSVQFTVDPDLLSRPLRIQFTSAAASASREIDLRGHFSPSPVVLSASDGGAVPLGALATSFTNRIVDFGLGALPPDARALRGVSHLVLYDQSLRDLSRAQRLALDSWLASGGRMVIIGSLNFKLYQEPQLERYLPVRVTGVKQVTFAPSGEAGNAGSVAGVWAQTAAVLRGRVVTGAHGMPVIVESDWGRGRVTYLALDAGRPPLSHWPGLPKLLQGLLAPSAEESTAYRPQWNEDVFSRLLLSPWFIASYIPTRLLFFAVLGYLAGIVVLVRLWQHGRIRRRALVGACCGWILCSAAAGYFLFSRGGQVPEGVLLEATIMDNAGGGYVDAQTSLALFSTQPREYGLGFGQGWLELQPLAAPGQPQQDQPVVYQHGGGAARVQLPIKAWDYRLLRARAVEHRGLSAEIELQEGQLLLKVRNGSGGELADCWLVAPGTRVALGDLPKGESWTKRIALGDAGGGQQPRRNVDDVSLRDIAFREQPRDILFHSSFFLQEGANAPWRGRVAIFFGWLKEPGSRADAGDPRIRVQSYALFRAIVPLPAAEEE